MEKKEKALTQKEINKLIEELKAEKARANNLPPKERLEKLVGLSLLLLRDQEIREKERLKEKRNKILGFIGGISLSIIIAIIYFK
jgi:hypothetical protein